MSEQPPSIFEGKRELFLEKPLPNSEEAERAVLGSILLDNTHIAAVSEVLKPTDFYSPIHRRVYEAMIFLFDASQNIDPITVGEEIRKRDSIESMGGISSIANLTWGLHHSIDLSLYVKLIKDASDRRKLVKACNQITSEALEMEDTVESVLEKAENLIYSIRSHSELIKAVPMDGEVAASLERAKERTHMPGGVVVGLPTGFGDIDFRLQGYRPGSQIIIAARPSIGKTSLLLQILYHIAAVHGASVLLFSLEMSRDEIADRIVCAQANIDSYLLRAGHLSDRQWEEAELVKTQLTESAGFFINDSPTMTLRGVRAEVRRVNTKLQKMGKPPLSAVGLDHLGLMKNDVEKRGRSREGEVSENSQGLRQAAREFGYTSIVLSQLNRMSENRTGHKPMMSDLRESGAIEQDADVVKLLFREDVYQDDPAQHTNIAEVIIGKNRNGPTGTVRLYFTRKSTRFSDLNQVAENDEPLFEVGSTIL